MGMVDETIKFSIEIDGSQPIREFSNITQAGQSVVDAIDKIQKSTADVIPGTDTFFQESRDAVYNSTNRINQINKTIGSSPFFSEKQLSDLYKERDLLVRGIEATYKDVLSFSKATSSFVSSSGSDGKALSAISSMLPQLLSFVSEVSAFQAKANTLMDSSVFKSGIKNKISEAGLFEKLGFSKGSQQADSLAEYLMLRGSNQTQRKSFMGHISQGSEEKMHIYDSFIDMLPSAFRGFHERGGTSKIDSANTQKLTEKETKLIEGLLLSNPYFAKAAEQAKVAQRLNGKMRIAGGLTRNDINIVASNLYDTIIDSAKGMPMYGITDVDNPDYWERIARKTNKPILGSMNSARVLSDNLSWLDPGRASKQRRYPKSAYYDVGNIGFSPMIKRYEVAKYNLSDLRSGTNLNGKERLYDKAEDHYFALDNSLHLEKILSSGKRKTLPKHNEAIDDLFYVELDPRLANPNLSEDERRRLEDEYARYIESGITKKVNGVDTHFTFSRAHKSLGLEFVNDVAYNKITNGGKDKSFFRGGLKNGIFESNDAYPNFAKAIEYASKNATSGENIADLFGTELPDELKIAIFDLEEAAKNNGIGAGMNGQSYINKKYVPHTGFQARFPGVKTALNTIDPVGFLKYFGGPVKTLGPNGEIETIKGDEDLLLSWTDLKNAGIKYKNDDGSIMSLAEIKKEINKEFKQGGGKIFAARTMSDANGKIHWMSGQLAQNLKGDNDFVNLTTKAFLDEYVRAGTLEGALSSVFAGDSETRDLLLATNGAVLGDRRIQERISEYRQEMLARISKGDVILPKELASQRAMASPWLFNAIASGAKKINAEGTGVVKEGEKSYYDKLYDNLSAEQRQTLNLITMQDDEVAFQNLMASILGIGRYPATSRSARKVSNVLAQDSARAKAMKQALNDAGFDPNSFYISPSSPIMDMLQDADFDGDVMELIGLAYSGKDKTGKQITAAEILNKAFDLGMKRIDQAGLSKAEADARKAKWQHTVFGGNKFSMDNGQDVMKVISAMMQDGSFMGAPNAVMRNASQIPWDSTVLKAMADAESQYSVNSVRGKKGIEMDSSREEIEIMSKYRPFQEFFHMVDSNRNQYGNIDESKLIEAARSSDGLNGARFWNTNLPFHTMSASVRQGLLSRYFLKQRGVDINKDYDWNYIFDTVLGKKDESTALGRMQSALRDTWMGYLNADYLAVDDEVIAKLGDLRAKAIDEQQALVKADRDRLGDAYDKKGSNLSIATSIVDRLGGRVISNAVAGMALSSGKMNEGDNASMFKTLEMLGMPGVVGNLDFSNLLLRQTSPDSFKNMTQSSSNSEMYRLVQQFNLLNVDQKKRLIDNMPRLSFSSMEKLAYDPLSFLKMIVEGREQELSSPAIEVGQAAHAAIEHFMSKRMGSQTQLSEDQLKEAQAESLRIFDEYLGLQDRQLLQDSDMVSRGLNDAERKDLRTQGTKLNARYNKLRQFLSSQALLDIYPEEDWQVVGIESSDVGNDEKASGNRMKIHGFGNQLTNGKEVNFTGAYDLRFKNRSTGQEVVADIKNYWDPNESDWEKWRVQQELYVNQLIKNGVPIDQIGIIMPYQKQLRQMEFNKADLDQNFDNVKRSVEAVQQLANGEMTIQSFLDVSRFVRSTMFGDAGKDFGSQYTEWNKKKSTATKFNPNMITDALLMHDKYREAVEAEEDINKFINQKTRPRDKTFMDSQLWASKYNEAETIKAQANLERIAKNNAQADDLEARYNATIGNLNQGLATAAFLDEQNLGEDIRKSIKGNAGTAKIQDLIKEYTDFKTKKESNENERELARTKIKEGEERLKKLTDEESRYTQQKNDISKEQEYIDKLAYYSDKAKHADTEKQAKIWRDTRADYIKRHSDISGMEEYQAINSAYENQNEETASQLLADRRAVLKGNFEKLDQMQNENKEEQSKNKADLTTLNAGLTAAEAQADLNKTYFDQYKAQVQKTATDILTDTFDSLTAMIEGESNKPMDLASGRAKFVENVQNARTDVLDLLSKDIISEDEAAKRIKKANELLSDESLIKFDQQQVQKAKEKLQMTGSTPAQQADKWLNDRLKVLEADTEVKRMAMMGDLNAADAAMQSLLGTGSPDEEAAIQRMIDLNDKYNNINKEEEALLRLRRDEMEKHLTEQRQQTWEDYQQSIKGTQLTPDEKISRYVKNAKNKLTNFRDSLALDDPMVAEIDKLLNDKEVWEKYGEREAERQKDQDALRSAQQQSQLDKLDAQNTMASISRQRQYERFNRNRFVQPTSRFESALQQQVDYRNSLQDSIKSNTLNRDNAKIMRDYWEGQMTKFSGDKSSREYKDAEFNFKSAETQMRGYSSAIQDAQNQMKGFGAGSMVMAAGINTVSSGISMITRRLGRQMFQKAVAEAKKFVQEFDKSMTTIQMITLKSDSQMATLGDGLISKAKELKISISEITKSAETLYRQGLSDQEVDDRLETISKFSKVSGTSVDAATKLITVAMNTGLVSSPETAADIVTALGDNAATNASEIEKGIEKAGAAAAADGTTFGQLAAMLTAITSTTQIGGNVAGRTLNTIFGRMNKIGTNELIYDENGNAVSGSAVAKLLKAQGVETYDKNGNKRSSFDVLYDLSKKWDSLSDATQQQLASQIAGTRQYSNFAAIMQGMSEGKIDEYMELLGSSTGITDKKYSIYTKSLQASLTDLKNTFDSMIEDLADKGYVNDFMQSITTMIKGVNTLVSAFGGLKMALPTILAVVGALKGFQLGGGWGALIGAGLAFGGYSLLTTLGQEENKTATEVYNENIESNKNKYNSRTENIERLRTLASKDKLTDDEAREYKVLTNKLGQYAGVDQSVIDAANASLKFANAAGSVAKNAEDAAKASKDFANEIAKQAEDELNKEKVENIYEGISKASKSIAETTDEDVREYHKDNGIYNELKRKFDEWADLKHIEDYTFGEEGFQKVVKSAVTRLNFASNGLEKNAAEQLLQFTAEYLAKTSNDNPDLQGKDKNYWYNKLINSASVDVGGVGVSAPFWADLFNGYETVDPNIIKASLIFGAEQVALHANGAETQKKGLAEGFERIFKNNGIDEDLIPYLVENAIEGYYADERTKPENGIYPEIKEDVVSDQLKRIYGYEGNGEYDIVKYNESVKQAARDKGWTTRADRLEKIGLPDVGETGYFIDLNKSPGENGYYISQEEAIERVNAYNESLNPVKIQEQNNKLKIGDTTIASYTPGDKASTDEAGRVYANAVTKIQGMKDEINKYLSLPSVQELSIDEKETAVMNYIKAGMKEIGVDYTGALADFLLTDAKDMVVVAEETIEKELTKPLDEPKLKGIKDYALGEVETSYGAWVQDKNVSYKLVADRVYNEMKQSNASDIDTWLKYVNDNGIRDFETLYQNAEFGKLMHQVSKNAETGKYEGPADIMDQIRAFILTNGSEGSAFVSDKQKADYAQSMYDTLVSGETVFFSLEEAENKEKKERDAYEAEIEGYVENARKIYGSQLTDKGYSDFEKGVRIAHPYMGFVAEGARYYSDDEKKYLKEVVGQELYDKLTGRSGVAATADERAYAALLISNKRYGLTSFTTQQQYDWLKLNKSRLSTIGQEGGLSRTVADAYLSQWSDWPRYAALIEKKNTSGLTADELDQLDTLTKSLDNLEQQYQIKIDIEGIQQLEEAGEITSGIASEIEKLKKGGKFEIEVLLNYKTEAFEKGQQSARLRNGTKAQQAEAAMAILGMSPEQYYANEDENYADALDQDIKNREQRLKDWQTRYDNASETQKASIVNDAASEGFVLTQRTVETQHQRTAYDTETRYRKLADIKSRYSAAKSAEEKKKIEQEALDYGFEVVTSESEPIEDYEVPTGMHLGQNGMLLDANNVAHGFAKKITISPMAETQFVDKNEIVSETKTENVFEDNGVPKIIDNNPLVSQQRIYSDAEKNIMLDQLLAITDAEKLRAFRTTGENGNSELVDAAIASAGTYSQELLRRVFQGEEIDPWLRIASEKERSDYKASQLTGFASSFEQANRAQYALDNYTPDNANLIATFLNMGESDVKRMMESNKPEDKALLQEKINNTVKSIWSQMSEMFSDISLDLSNTSNMKQQLLDAAAKTQDEFTKRLLEWMAGLVDSATGGLTGESGYSSFETAVSSRQKTTVETQNALNEAYKNFISTGNYTELNSSTLADWSTLPDDLLYMMYDRAKGNQTFTDEEINTTYNNALYGRKSSPKTQQKLLESLFNGDMSAENMVATYRNWLEDQTSPENAANLAAFSSLDNIDQVEEALKSQEGAIQKTTQAMKQYNQEVGPNQIKYLKKYGDYTDEVAESMLNLAKGGKTATKEIAALRTKALGNQDLITAASKARGKSGKNLDKTTRDFIAGYLGVDSEYIKQYTQSELNDICDQIENQVNDEFTQTNLVPTIQTALDELSKNMDPVELHEAMKVVIDGNGELDINALSSALQVINPTIANALRQYEGLLAEYHVRIQKSQDENGGDVYVVGEASSKLNAGSSYNKGGGGGGGGGKSDTDKLLEEQKRKVAEAQHKSKMLEIAEKELDYGNRYTAWGENIDDQITAQENLRKVYQENLKEMKQMLSSVEQGSDDWNKLKESIMQTEEALAEISNTINELNAKHIQILQQNQENADKPGMHNQTMLEKLASRAMNEDRFKDYEKLTLQNIDEINAQKGLNDRQIVQWESELKRYEENTDSWNEVRDKIWAIEDENAELENQAIQKMLDLNSQRLSQIGKILQENTQSATHNMNVASTYGGAYQTGGFRSQYEDMIRTQLAMTDSIIEENKVAEKAALDQMNSLEKESTAWFEAQAAAYQYEETIAQTVASQMELNRTLAESNLDGVTETYTDATRELSHVNELLSTQAQEYLDANDYEAYFTAMASYMENIPRIIEAEQTALNTLWSQYNEGMENGTLDPAMQRSYLDQINERETELQRLVIEQRKQQREIDKNSLDKLLEDQEWDASEYNHNIQRLSYETTKYQNAGELTNVNTMLKEDTKLREDRIDALKDEVKVLKERQKYFQDTYGEGTDDEKRIVEQIRKREEALAQENVQLAKNTKLLEENEKKIAQLRKTLEDAIDKEIEAEKKRKREILAGNVSMQNTIVEQLRNRMKEEWAIQKQGIEKEKEALNEYKKLINERFNYRKKASQQADKDEELAEYRRQLALIEADPSRTKDAKELRRKIEDMEKEQAWTIAEDEVNAENERINDQMEGMDKYVQYEEQLINEILSDANNFSTELNDILSGSFEESYAKIIEFMRKENEAFMNSLPDAQQQMIQSWEDTWKKANDIIDSNYSEISKLLYDQDTGELKSMDEYMDYMRSKDRMYRSYLENGDQNSIDILERQWEDAYNNYANAIKTGAEFEVHDHDLGDVVSKVDELKDNIFQVNIIGIDGVAPGPYGLGGEGRYKDFSFGDYYTLNDYAGVGYVAPKEVKPKPQPQQQQRSYNNYTPTVKTPVQKEWSFSTMDERGYSTSQGGTVTAATYEEALKKAEEKAAEMGRLVEIVAEKTDTTATHGNITTTSSNWSSEGTTSTTPTTPAKTDDTPKTPSTNLTNGLTPSSVKTSSSDEGVTALANNTVAINNLTAAVMASLPLTATIPVRVPGNANGGLVDYTGLAWVDGTKTNPESFLDATDTKLLRDMLDSYNYVATRPHMSYVDPSIGVSNTTVGDINITINQAELASDADYDKVAKRVGQAFTKELQRNGLNLSGYAFA